MSVEGSNADNLRFTRKGFSLLEVILALAILSTSILLLAGLFPSASLGIATARNMDLGRLVAHDKLEEWAQQGYTWIVSQPAGAAGTVAPPSPAGDTPNPTFSWTLAHSPIVSGGVEQIDVLVSWTQKSAVGSSLKFVRLTTWVAP